MTLKTLHVNSVSLIHAKTCYSLGYEQHSYLDSISQPSLLNIYAQTQSQREPGRLVRGAQLIAVAELLAQPAVIGALPLQVIAQLANAAGKEI